MRHLSVFIQVSVDGYFVDRNGGMDWAHRARADAEWNKFVEGNASGDGTLVFGRKTYDMMSSYWPTPMAMQNDPVVARRMNDLPKIVFSRTMERAAWQNTTLVKGDLAAEVRRLKQASGTDMVILGSGSIVSQLAEAGLIDLFQIVVLPIAVGGGRTIFETVKRPLGLRLTQSRAFGNENVVLDYEPVA